MKLKHLIMYGIVAVLMMACAQKTSAPAIDKSKYGLKY